MTTTLDAKHYPRYAAVNPLTNKAYIANWGSTYITAIDGITNDTSSIAVDSAPKAIAVNPATNKIYVACYGSGTAVVIDGFTQDTTVVPVGSEPWDIAVNPATNKIYVANMSTSTDTGTVTVIDGETNQTTTVPVGWRPYALAVNPITNKIYVANNYGSNVTIIDGLTNDTTVVAAGQKPSAIAVNPVTNKIYVGNDSWMGDSGSVTVIDGTTLGTVSLSRFRMPLGIAVNPVTNKVYISDCGQDSIAIIDGATLSIAKLTGGVGPLAVAVNPVTNKVYVTKDTDNDVTVIDEMPFRDTRIHAEMESYLNHASTLARPPLVGRAVNRWTPYRTQIEGILNRPKTDQKSWDLAEIIRGARSDSVVWAWNWGADSLIMGENWVCAVPIESDGANTNNTGFGTPFAGNLLVFPFYRIDPRLGVEDHKGFAGRVDILFAAKPNPTSGPTCITYSLTHPGHVSLKLYDITGRLVTVLQEGEKRTGIFSVSWDGRDNKGHNLPSGIYLYRLETENSRAVKKLVLLR